MTDRETLELSALKSQISKSLLESQKLEVEIKKMRRETTLYSAVVATGMILALAGIFRLFI